MSSQLGHVGMSGRNVYNMTKFGIEGLTKGMGVELAKKYQSKYSCTDIC